MISHATLSTIPTISTMPMPMRSSFPHPAGPPVLEHLVPHPRAWRIPGPAPGLMGWQQGHPEGQAWLVLHGGPGSTAQPGLLSVFDAERHWAWAMQQRGSGPLAWPRSTRWHVDALVADAERLRHALGLRQWAVLGGSWGALLALAYVRRHPQAVSRLVLRGTFLGRSAEVWGLMRTLWALRLSWPCHPAGPWCVAPEPQRLCPQGWLRHCRSVSRFATPGAVTPSERHLVWAWLTAETQLALRGAARALRHAHRPPIPPHHPNTLPTPQTPSMPPLRRVWAQLRQDVRLGLARGRMQRMPSPAQRHKVALQTRVLSSGYRRVLQGGLPDWANWLTQATPSGGLHLLHGRWDGVCPPSAVQRWASGLEQSRSPQRNTQPHVQQHVQSHQAPVGVQWVNSGHLASEPAMQEALRAALAPMPCAQQGQP